MQYPRALSAVLLSSALAAGCQTAPDNGLFGSNGYLQLYVDDVLVWENSVPGGGMNCQKNAALNNREIDPKQRAIYKCSREPAPADALPYSFYAVSVLGTLQGYRDSNPSTTRFASSEACHDAVAYLSKQDMKLISEKCDGDMTPPRAKPGDRHA